MRYDDDLDFGGYRATRDWRMLIPIIIVAILLIIAICILVTTNKKT